MTDSYYADTAYNSQHPRDLSASRSRDDDGYFTNKALGRPLGLPRKAHCREFIGQGTTGNWLKAARQRGEWAYPPEKDGGPHEKMIWANIFEWSVFIRFFNHIFGIFLLVGGGGEILFTMYDHGVEGAMESVSFLFFPTLAWLIIKFLTRKEPKLKTDTRFLRRTGMVSIYLGKGERAEHPFDEFEPYVSFTTGPTGSSNLVLNLGHRYSDLILSHHNSFMDEASLQMEWELLCEFMDTSRPLPETPDYETCRHWDPVSRAYDKKHNRPSNYWQSISRKALGDLCLLSYQAARDYPWGKTRQEALDQGWKPSEQRWKEQQDSDTSSVTE